VFDARASIHDVNEIMGLHLDDSEFDTLGGLVYDRLGKVPVVGDEVHLNGLTISVLSAQGRRVKKVRVRVGAPATPAATEG
jgi:CBS domain containing-hemolysin-like protein